MDYRIAYETIHGAMYHGKCEEVLKAYRENNERLVNLIFTSPPFPLNRAKKYGNMTGEEYIDWLTGLATLFSGILSRICLISIKESSLAVTTRFAP